MAVPPGVPLDEARAEVRALAPQADADFNHYYRAEADPSASPASAPSPDPSPSPVSLPSLLSTLSPLSAPSAAPTDCNGPQCTAFRLIGWTESTAPTCPADIVVGVIDTGINPAHEAFASARLEVHRLTPGTLDPSGAIHGTAVTAILIGNPAGRTPGLVPTARVISVLEEAITRMAERDILVVAATGNGGPLAPPVYPAAYPSVLAVTAVDANGTVYRRAGQGPHVDLAAPGVDIWTAASIKGARPKTGTSFAAPFVSAAAAAILAAEPDLTAAEVIARLTASAKDLGDPGPDAVYGYGLVQASPICLMAQGDPDL
ncbi:MAG: hypothetical protein B7Z31_00895 [Rhodobacterales bacterium 12-65-15]|nr:MAG: hypothetical protein B7Z31_00895 [Rhodobacterales bacterium 12-65-15]